jgi:polyferredoxin
MEKIGRPTRLIAYDTDVNIKRRAEGLPAVYRLIRPRTILYAAVMAVVGSTMLYALTSRANTSLAVIHDRNPLFVRTADGSIRNGYEIRIANKATEMRRFTLEVMGLNDAKLEVVGDAPGAAPRFEVGPDQTQEIRVLVMTPKPPAADATTLVFSAKAEDGQVAASTKDFFRSGAP